MWGHIRQTTIQTPYYPGRDGREADITLNVIEIFNTEEELKTWLGKNFPGKDVKIFELKPITVKQEISFE